MSFSCLIALARTSSTMLPKSQDSGNPCLPPDLREKAFNLLPLGTMVIWACYIWSLLW